MLNIFLRKLQLDNHVNRRVNKLIRIRDSNHRETLCSVIYDPNDPELKESLKYLALPTEERIKMQAQPFDGKKQCWVPDPKDSFIAAEITGTKGEEVTAKTAKGDVRERSTTFTDLTEVLRFRCRMSH